MLSFGLHLEMEKSIEWQRENKIVSVNLEALSGGSLSPVLAIRLGEHKYSMEVSSISVLESWAV